MDQKVELVNQHRHRFGLNACLRALALSKGTWHHRQHRRSTEQRDQPLKQRVRDIIEDHPGYGYRPILAELNDGSSERVNHKRLRRVLNTYDLGLPRCLPATRPSSVQRLIGDAGSSVNLVRGRDFDALEAFTTDFTELIYAGGARKAYLIVLLDLGSRWVGGWAVSPSANHLLALTALDRLCAQLAYWGMDLRSKIVHHDRDPVFTSKAWLQRLLLAEHARVSFTVHGARDNPSMESFWGRFKTENRALIREAQTLSEVTELIPGRIDYYNCDRRHSSLGQISPWTVLAQALSQNGHAKRRSARKSNTQAKRTANFERSQHLNGNTAVLDYVPTPRSLEAHPKPTDATRTLSRD